MEDVSKDQSSAPVSVARSTSKLRYPLRSAIKPKEEKPPATELPKSSASKRGKPPSSISKSVGVLDLSGKDKSAKPTRRLSIPAKSSVSPHPIPIGNISPISEARTKRLVGSHGKTGTPLSDISRSSSRKKSSNISSTSYWLSHIKQSESAAKHNISLCFFKLALEAGCEPIQKMRGELRSYARRHNISELGESVKELFDIYNISENFEQLQVSETCSQVPEEESRSSDDDVQSSSSIPRARKLKPRSLNTDATAQASLVPVSAKEATKKDSSGARTRGSSTKNSANQTSASERHNLAKNAQKQSRKVSNRDKDKAKQQRKTGAHEEGPADTSPAEEVLQENKENNMDASQKEEISCTEV